MTAPGFIELEYDLSRLEELAADAKDIPDDYAEDYQFGLYVDDYENARDHLLKSLWSLVACANDDANPAVLDGVADRARKLAVVLNDLAHYLDTLIFGAKITDETEAAFLKCCEVVVDLGYG